MWVAMLIPVLIMLLALGMEGVEARMLGLQPVPDDPVRLRRRPRVSTIDAEPLSPVPSLRNPSV
jgi:hypothetical protein